MFFNDIVLCENADFLSIVQVILNVIRLVCIIAPILVIIFVSLDFAKAVISSSEDEMSKATKVVVQRLIYCVAVFLAPSIVTFSMNLLSDAGVDFASCIANATTDKIESLKSANQSTNSSTEQTENKVNSNSNNTSKTEQKTNVVFKLKDSDVVLGHYTKDINTYTIIVTDKNGKKLSASNFTFTSKNPAIASVSSTGQVTAKFRGKTSIIVAQKGNSSNLKNFNVTVVSTLYTKVKTNKSLTVTNIVTGKSETLKKETKGVLNGIGSYTDPGLGGYSNGLYNGASSNGLHGYMKGDILKVGNNYYLVSASNVTAYNYSIAGVYDKATAEGFVNDQGFKSSTKYLFWTSQGTQVMYMFKGSKGKWKLYKTFNVSTGDVLGFGPYHHNRYPGTGVYFDYYIVGRIAPPPSGYSYRIIWKQTNGGGEGNPWHEFGNGSRFPASHGCTQLTGSDLNWLLNNHSSFKGSRIEDY